MRINENGISREMTAEEIAELNSMSLYVPSTSDPLTDMAAAMSTATSLAQMRAAAKAFLDATEKEVAI